MYLTKEQRYPKPPDAKGFLGHIETSDANYDIWVSNKEGYYLYRWGERRNYDSVSERILRQIYEREPEKNQLVDGMIALIDLKKDPSISPMAYK